MSIEGICTVYANILRDHINGVSALKHGEFSLILIFIKQHFDGLCKTEVVSAS